MTVNREMFAEIHTLLIEFPELHRQASWETDPGSTGNCGTTRCIAGWATWIGARDAGLLMKKRQMTSPGIRTELAAHLGLVKEDIDPCLSEYETHDYAVIGARLLGLSGQEAHSLFMDLYDERVLARVKSFAETGEDISDEEYDRYGD